MVQENIEYIYRKIAKCIIKIYKISVKNWTVLVKNTVRDKIEKFWFFSLENILYMKLEYRSIEFKYNLQNYLLKI